MKMMMMMQACLGWQTTNTPPKPKKKAKQERSKVQKGWWTKQTDNTNLPNRKNASKGNEADLTPPWHMQNQETNKKELLYILKVERRSSKARLDSNRNGNPPGSSHHCHPLCQLCACKLRQSSEGHWDCRRVVSRQIGGLNHVKCPLSLPTKPPNCPVCPQMGHHLFLLVCRIHPQTVPVKGGCSRNSLSLALSGAILFSLSLSLSHLFLLKGLLFSSSLRGCGIRFPLLHLFAEQMQRLDNIRIHYLSLSSVQCEYVQRGDSTLVWTRKGIFHSIPFHSIPFNNNSSPRPFFLWLVWFAFPLIQNGVGLSGQRRIASSFSIGRPSCWHDSSCVDLLMTLCHSPSPVSDFWAFPLCWEVQLRICILLLSSLPDSPLEPMQWSQERGRQQQCCVCCCLSSHCWAQVYSQGVKEHSIYLGMMLCSSSFQN